MLLRALLLTFVLVWSKAVQVCGRGLKLDDLPEEILGKLPPGTSVEELEQASLRALESFMEKIFDPIGVRGRSLALEYETAYYPCNTVIHTLTVEDLIENGKGLVGDQREVQDLAYTEAILFALDMLLLSLLKYDLQVWKVCGRCTDFAPAVGVACEKHEYGYNATQSGLLVAPYNTAEGRIFESTLPVNVISAAGGAVPSELWTKPLTHPLPILGALVTSGSGTYTLMPDNIGTGESADHYKAFLIRQSLVTGVAPVLWQAESIISQETNCASALGNAFVVSGYSEGGYGAVAVADALSRMGKTIIACHAGGGAYRLSSATVTAALKDVRDGDKHMTFYMTLLGSALSSTTSDVANYGQGEDFIEEDWRDFLVEAVQRTVRRQHPLKMLIPDDDPMSVFNQELVAVYETGMANGEAEPCVTSVNNQTEAICKALRDQDLTGILESANYPVYLCHSYEDDIISFKNIPDVNANPTYLHLKTVSGRHEPAGGACIVANLLYIANDDNVKNFPVQDRTCESGCGCELFTSDEPLQNDSPDHHDCNLLLAFFGISCEVKETYSGWGWLGIDFSW